MWTGDLRSAGTDANVFIQMYGENGKTEEYSLRNKTDNFETSEVDKFKVGPKSMEIYLIGMLKVLFLLSVYSDDQETVVQNWF